MDRPFKPMYGIVSQVFLQLVVASQVNEMHQLLSSVSQVFRVKKNFSDLTTVF